MQRIFCQRDCPDACSLLVTPEGEVRGDPHHPVTRGFACIKAMNFLKYYKSERRVLYPHIREGGRYKRVSWDEAISLIALKLRSILKEYGPREVLVVNYSGNSGLLSFNYPLRLFYALNATVIDYTICDEAGEVAVSLHYGKRYGAFPDDMENAEMLAIWGANIASSSVHAYRIAVELKRKGVPIWTIDPRRTRTSLLGRHIRPKPGSDSVLAMGVSWYIINEFGVDLEFIKRYTIGFEAYKELISKFPPDKVEAITGVPKGEFRDLARDYVERRPSISYIGVGLQKTRYGAEAVRAISLIPALVGVHRGFFYCNSVRDLDTDYLKGKNLGNPSVVNMLDIGPLLSSGKFKFLYIYGCNPAITFPRSDLIRDGLAREDLYVVVHDVVWSETAEMADIVLPATSMFEQFDVVGSWWHPYVGYSSQVIEPAGESKPNWWVTQEIARKIGLDVPELYEDPIEALKRALRSSKMLDGGLDALMEKGYVKLKYPPKDSYQTPSGKIEFYSSKALEMGYSPLPNVGWDVEVDGYPFKLISSSVPERTSTQDMMPEDLVKRDSIYISRDDAESLGLEEGGLVRVTPTNGSSIIATISIDDNLLRGVVWARRGSRFIIGTLNDLLTNEKQKIAEGNTLNSNYVRIERV